MHSIISPVVTIWASADLRSGSMYYIIEVLWRLRLVKASSRKPKPMTPREAALHEAKQANIWRRNQRKEKRADMLSRRAENVRDPQPPQGMELQNVMNNLANQNNSSGQQDPNEIQAANQRPHEGQISERPATMPLSSANVEPDHSVDEATLNDPNTFQANALCADEVPNDPKGGTMFDSPLLGVPLISDEVKIDGAVTSNDTEANPAMPTDDLRNDVAGNEKVVRLKGLTLKKVLPIENVDMNVSGPFDDHVLEPSQAENGGVETINNEKMRKDKVDDVCRESPGPNMIISVSHDENNEVTLESKSDEEPTVAKLDDPKDDSDESSSNIDEMKKMIERTLIRTKLLIDPVDHMSSFSRVDIDSKDPVDWF